MTRDEMKILEDYVKSLGGTPDRPLIIPPAMLKRLGDSPYWRAWEHIPLIEEVE